MGTYFLFPWSQRFSRFVTEVLWTTEREHLYIACLFYCGACFKVDFVAQMFAKVLSAFKASKRL